MDRTDDTVAWIAGIVLVILVLAGIWWYASSINVPGIPNTGTENVVTPNTDTNVPVY